MEKQLAVPVSGYTLQPGRRMELKLHVPAASLVDMVTAYDTTTHPSILGVP